MSGPSAPNDPELRETINRFAHYVAANGPATEGAERKRNFGNPQMSFLFNGNGATYYQFRLSQEINHLREVAQNPQIQHQIPHHIPQIQHHIPQLLHQQQIQHHIPQIPMNIQMNAPTPLSDIRIPPPLHAQSVVQSTSQSIKNDPEIDPLEAQIQALRQQITDSEHNLKAHYATMQETKRQRVDKQYHKKETDRIFILLDRVGIDYSPFVNMVDHLATSASKETISKCKHWIFSSCDTDQKREIILSYLLHRCRSDESHGILRLHILYLINDWAYYCQRQKLDNIRQMLSRYVPKMYAHATTTSEITSKLDKLVGVWEGNKYFDENCYRHIVNVSAVLASELATIEAEKSKIGDEVERDLKLTYSNYQKQHNDYERHSLNQISSLQIQISKIQEMREERTRLQSVKLENRLIPKAPYYELPVGMILPLVKPDSVTFEPIDPSLLRLPNPNLLTERLKGEVENFYSVLHNPDISRIDSDCWEIKGLSEFYAIKNHHRRKITEEMEADGKTFEDAVTNKQSSQLEQDRPLKERIADAKRSRRSDSISSSSGSSSSSSSSGSPSSARKVDKSRSASPDQRPTFSGGNDTFKVPGLPLQNAGNKGAHLLQKMGWIGGGLGSDGKGREEPIDAGTARHPQDQFRGIGSEGDQFDEYRKRMSSSKSGRN